MKVTRGTRIVLDNEGAVTIDYVVNDCQTNVTQHLFALTSLNSTLR